MRRPVEFIKRHPLLTIISGLATIIVVVVIVARANQSAEELRERASRNLNGGYYRQAWNDIRRSLAIDPDDEESLIIAAAVALQLSEVESANEYYRQIETPRLLDQHVLLIRTCLRNEQFDLAEHAARKVLARRANHPQATAQLLEIYRSTGRKWEHRELLLKSLETTEPALADALALFELPNLTDAGAQSAAEQSRDLAHPQASLRLAACVNYIRHDEIHPAGDVLHQIVAEHADFLEAQAQLGLFLVEQGDFPRLRDWASGLPLEALNHPRVCYAVGVLLEEEQHVASALAFQRHALRLDYRQRDALEHFIGLLVAAPPDVIDSLQEVVAQEAELEVVIRQMYIPDAYGALNPELGAEGLQLIEQMQWLPEGRIWSSIFVGNDNPDLIATQHRIESRLLEVAAQDPADRDWPTIEPLIRRLNLPDESIEMLLARLQDALRED